ncbi:MAG: M1 family metallopeptidase [archaeon]|nr:M1 family metallopeptidase [archaeon]
MNFSYYNLSMKLDESNSIVDGNLSVIFCNNDPVSFSRIPFHLYPSGMYYEARKGKIDIIDITISQPPFTSLSYNVHSDEQLMWVNLNSDLLPSQNVSFKISFKTTLPDGGFDRASSHGGSGERIYKVSSAYPIPCVYDELDGWNIDPYLQIGDPFYLDMAYYDFYVEVPNSMIVAATGELQDTTLNGLTTKYHYDPIFPVREVTFSASRDFVIESTIFNGINISAYFLSRSSGIWEDDVLDYASTALKLYNDTFGIYPYLTFNLVEEYTLYLGMEYPCQVYISEALHDNIQNSGWDSWIFEEVIVHEIAHQWWYQLVGNDEVDWGFLDEGLTCWSTDYYAEIKYGKWEYFQPSYLGYLTSRERVNKYFVESEGKSSRINQSSYEYIASDSDYVYIEYVKTPVVLEKLRITIGNNDFLYGLQHFCENNFFQIATLKDLQISFEEVTAEQLNWFFLPWFDNLYLPKYSFLATDFDPGLQLLTVVIEDLNEDLNNYSYSQPVLYYVYNSIEEVMEVDYILINGTTTFSVALSEQPAKIKLDYTEDVLVQLSDSFVESITKVIGTNWNSVIIMISAIVAIGLGIGIYLLRLRKRWY